MGYLDFDMSLCLPSVTEESRESIVEVFDKVQEFYRKNRGKLLHEIDGDTPKAILEDFLGPHSEGTAFEDNRDHYRNVLGRFNRYFNKLHMGTIDHMGDTPEDRAYERLFNQFRFNLLNTVQLALESIDIWYDRTHKWETKYSNRVH